MKGYRKVTNSVRYFILSAMVAVFALAGARESLAQTTETFTASVTVSSSLTITEATAMSFGQLVVVDDGTNAPTATMAADGTFTDNSTGSSSFVQLGTPAAGSYTVATGASVFSNIQITFPASASLAASGAAPSNGTFDIDTFTIGSPTAGSMTGTTTTVTACNTAISGGGNCDFQTDSSGNSTVPVGADISVNTSGDSYIDGSYTGTFDLVATFN